MSLGNFPITPKMTKIALPSRGLWFDILVLVETQTENIQNFNVSLPRRNLEKLVMTSSECW